MIDWGTGEYERTAIALEPAAEAVLAAAGVSPGDRVLDVACGTGNAAALAAAAGAEVTGLDQAERLLGVARERVPEATFVAGDATALPFPDATFDVAMSVFGVIFAQPAAAAAAELARVVRPGGRIVLTAWRPEGAIFEVGMLMRAASGPPPPDVPSPVAWHDEDVLRQLFPHPLAVERHELAFTAASPEAWWDEQVAHHPMWMAGGVPVAALRDRAAEILDARNQDPDALRVTSAYALVTVER